MLKVDWSRGCVVMKRQKMSINLEVIKSMLNKLFVPVG